MKKRKTFLIIWVLMLIIFMGVGVYLLTQINKTGDYQEQITLGDKYLQEMDYENAELCYLEAIRISEKQVKPYVQLSKVYVAQNRYDDAVDILYQGLDAIEAEKRNEISDQIEYVVFEKRNSEESKITPELTPTATPMPTEEPVAEIPEPTQDPTPIVEETPSILQDRESVRKQIVDYYTNLWQPDGTYAIFESEDQDTAEGYMFILRYQMSEEAAAERIANGGTVSANTLVTAVYVNTTTGEVTDNINEGSWYIQ